METVSVGPKATTPCHVGEWPSLTLSLITPLPLGGRGRGAEAQGEVPPDEQAGTDPAKQL